MGAADQATVRERLFATPDRLRLAIGVGIAIVGPLLVTPVATRDPVAELPGILYLLAVVAATLVGRLVAGTVAVLVSSLLLDVYVIAPRGRLHLSDPAELVAILAFGVTALIVAQLLSRLDAAARVARRERERLVFLIRAGDVLGSTLDYEEAITELATLVVPTIADWCSVDLMDTPDRIDNLVVAHVDPKKVELAQRLQAEYPPDPHARTGVANVVQTGEPELYPEITEDMLRAVTSDEEQVRIALELGFTSAMVVPLAARGRTFGAITLVSAESGLRYGRDDLALVQELADRAALAIDNARLFRAEGDARSRMEVVALRTTALQNVTAALGSASTEEAVVDATIADGIPAAGARAGGIGLLRDSGRIEMVGTTGYETDDRTYWRGFDVDDPYPLAEAVRERRVVVFRSTLERDERYPALAGAVQVTDHAVVCVPLPVGDRTVGGLVASFPPETEFDDDRLAFLNALAEQCAQALDRVATYERERATRARLDVLAEVSRALASSLELDQVSSLVVRLAARSLGERAGLFLAEDATAVEAVTSARREGAGATIDPSIAELALEDAEQLALVRRAIASREPIVVDPGDVSPVAAGSDEGLPPATPGVVLPLHIAGRLVGALSVAQPERAHALSGDDRSFGQEVARRMARAIENSRAYRERDHVARTLQQSLLPPGLPPIPGVEIGAVFQPASEAYDIGGDFYDVFETSDGRWAAVIGDVCGKGIEAASLTSLARHTLRGASHATRPARALRILNEALLREELDGKFCTACYLLLDPRSDGVHVTLCVAGHPLPQVVRADGSIEDVGTYGTMLGVTDDPTLSDAEAVLAEGETLVLFTDGLLGKDDDEHDALEAVLSDASEGDVYERIRERVTAGPQARQDDDVAVLVLRATGRLS